MKTYEMSIFYSVSMGGRVFQDCEDLQLLLQVQVRRGVGWGKLDEWTGVIISVTCHNIMKDMVCHHGKACGFRFAFGARGGGEEVGRWGSLWRAFSSVNHWWYFESLLPPSWWYWQNWKYSLWSKTSGFSFKFLSYAVVLSVLCVLNFCVNDVINSTKPLIYYRYIFTTTNWRQYKSWMISSIH